MALGIEFSKLKLKVSPIIIPTMLNNLSFLRSVAFLVTCMFSVSCSQVLKRASILEPLKSDDSVELRLGSHTGRTEVVDYYSHSKVKAFELNQLVREKDEVVEFTTKTLTLTSEENPNLIRNLVTTIKKDGIVDLHDLAFPELEERIEFVFSPDAQVLYAGGYSESSVFFVPPLSLPTSPVKIGDTWEMHRSWVSAKNNIPLKLSMVTIFKGLYPCGKNRCADLEISGEVGIIATFSKDSQFSSQISGRLLFSVESGTIVWSQVKSVESLATNDAKFSIRSCLASQLKEPKDEVWLGSAMRSKKVESECDPLIDGIIVPGVVPYSEI